MSENVTVFAVAPYSGKVPDIARHFGVSEALVYAEIAAGSIPRRMIGTRNFVVRYADMQAWVDGLPSDPDEAA